MKFDYRKTPDVQEWNPVIPTGNYEAKVIKVSDNYPTAKGYEQWIIKLEILNGNYAGYKIDDFNVFSPGLDSANKGMLKAFGFPVDTEELNIEAEELIGKCILVTIIVDNYNGKERNKVERFGGYQPLGREYINKDDDMSDIPF